MSSNQFFNKYQSALLWLFIILTFTSVNQWSSLPILNSQIERILQFAILIICIGRLRGHNWKKHKAVFWFIIWAAIGIIRGIFVADGYWEFNQLSIGTLSLSLPLFVYIFEDPNFVLAFNRKWIRWCILPFWLFFIWIVGATQFYLAPILFFAVFFFEIPFKWQLMIGILLLMMGLDLGARAQVIKVVISLSFALTYQFRKVIPEFSLKIVHWLFYGLAILLLYLGITGEFNIFKDGISKDGDIRGKYETKRSFTGESEDLSIDTRTFIYQEVIESAINNEYILFGRTPALGNDSYFGFDRRNKEYSKPIRYINEVCHPNIFTWLGLVGVILYTLIHLTASWLALYRSRSFALKITGCIIAFHWLLGWVENTNLFNISNIGLWMIIAMGYSERFREMSDKEYVSWFKNIFK